MRIEDMTRKQMIAHLHSVAKNWGFPTPNITERTSDAALRRIMRKLERDGERMGTWQQ